jgi:beta-lactam-binding protein with PASTA domain
MTDETARTSVMPSTSGPQVPTQTKVALLVSRGPAEAPVTGSDVPDVVGRSQDEALGILQTAGFEVEVLRSPNAAFKQGTISHQLPVSGSTATEGSKVCIISSTGSVDETAAMTSLPDVVGKPREEAERLMAAAGLATSVIEEYSTTVAKGLVYAQEPNSRTYDRVPPKKSMAWLWAILALIAVAIAAYFLFFTAAEDVTVPDVTGMTLEDAEVAITDAGLQIGRVTEEATEDVEAGLVISQTPPAGDTVSEGSRVDVVVARSLEGVEVPEVVGLSLGEATTVLEDAGLTVRSEEVFSEDVEAGFVVAQSPQPGVRVEAGAEVGLSVSKGPEPAANVTVPDLAGMTLADAQAALETAGLGSRVVQMNSDTVPAGSVIVQSPSSGSSVAPGTVVAVVESLGAPPMGTEYVDVPDVTGMERAMAKNTLETAGFDVEELELANAAVAKDTVFSQIPIAGQQAAEGSTVLIIISSGPAEQ